MNGRATSSVGPDDFTPGSASLANALSVGSASFSDASAGCAVFSVSRSAGTEASSASSWRAKAPAVVLKSVTRLLSERSSATRAAKVFCWPRSTRWRSRSGSSPRVASFASEELRYASSQYLIESLKPCAPLPSRPLEYSRRNVFRSSRVSYCSADSTWPNCTGAASGGPG